MKTLFLTTLIVSSFSTGLFAQESKPYNSLSFSGFISEPTCELNTRNLTRSTQLKISNFTNNKCGGQVANMQTIILADTQDTKMTKISNVIYLVEYN